MNPEHLEAVSEVMELRAHELIEAEGDLGRLALCVANACHSLEILARTSNLPPAVGSDLGSLIIEALVLAVGSNPNIRFASVYERASRIIEDAETAAGSSQSVNQTVQDILKKVR